MQIDKQTNIHFAAGKYPIQTKRKWKTNNTAFTWKDTHSKFEWKHMPFFGRFACKNAFFPRLRSFFSLVLFMVQLVDVCAESIQAWHFYFEYVLEWAEHTWKVLKFNANQRFFGAHFCQPNKCPFEFHQIEMKGQSGRKRTILMRTEQWCIVHKYAFSFAFCILHWSMCNFGCCCCCCCWTSLLMLLMVCNGFVYCSGHFSLEKRNAHCPAND